MNRDLSGLYRDVIVDHGSRPRNQRVILADASSAHGDNPLCGDEITVYLHLDGDVIGDVSFISNGCAISTASASLMTEALIGTTRAEALVLFDDIHAMLTSSGPAGTDGRGGRTVVEEAVERVGKLGVLAGVSEYPMRVKCATLAWHTFREALDAPPQNVAQLEDAR